MTERKKLLSGPQFAKRASQTLNWPVSQSSVYTWRDKGMITAVDDGRFIWPDAFDQVKSIIEKKKSYNSFRTEGPRVNHKDVPIMDSRVSKTAAAEPPALDSAEDFDQDIMQEEIPDAARTEQSMNYVEMIIDRLEKRVKGAEGNAYQFSRALVEAHKAKKMMLETLETEGKILDKQEVETFIYTISRQNRDTWLNWPEQAAHEMAQQLGVDPKMMHDVLHESVRKYLERIATMPESYSSTSDEGIQEGANSTP